MRLPRPVFLVLATLALAGCGDDAVLDGPSTTLGGARDGHARMVALLKDLAVRSADDHHYVGDRRARELRAELERRGSASPWELYRDAGIAELQLGHERAGIELLLQAYRGLSDGTLPGDQGALTMVAFYLGVGYMRLGETENCCQQPTAESCILPIRGAALHTKPEGSTAAARYFTEVLARTPQGEYWHLAARWLLNLAAMTLGTWPDAVPAEHVLPDAVLLTDPTIPVPHLQNVARGLGLDSFGLSGGAIVDDFDGDGDLDIMTSSWDPRAPMHFFRSEGDGTFTDRTTAANLGGLLGGLNLLQADYDNDGDLDFLVLRGAWLFEKGRYPNSLVRNEGDGTFNDVTFEAGLGAVHLPTQTAAWADYDNDGDLDLYVGNEHTAAIRAPGQLFRNAGDGTFTDVAVEAGVTNLGFAKSVSWGDFDGDRWPDLYVSNLTGPNRLYRNRGDGTFVDVAPRLEVIRPIESFPAWFWDYDNDGVLDLFVSSYSTGIGHLAAWHLGVELPFERARLYRGDGAGGFREMGGELGLGAPTMPMGSNFGDLDNDGWLDFYLGTGDTQYYSLMPNALYLNRGGQRFVDVTMASGLGHLQKGHGIAFADLDNDGDLDVFEEMGGAYAGDGFRDALYENPGSGNHWITVEVVGTRSNRSAIGARIRVEVTGTDGQPRSIYRGVNSGGSFGASPLRQTIGLGSAAVIGSIEVWFPTTAATQRVEAPGVDRAIRITEGEPDCVALPIRPFRLRKD